MNEADRRYNDVDRKKIADLLKLWHSPQLIARDADRFLRARSRAGFKTSIKEETPLDNSGETLLPLLNDDIFLNKFFTIQFRKKPEGDLNSVGNDFMRSFYAWLDLEMDRFSANGDNSSHEATQILEELTLEKALVFSFNRGVKYYDEAKKDPGDREKRIKASRWRAYTLIAQEAVKIDRSKAKKTT